MKKVLITHHMPGQGIAMLEKAGLAVVISKDRKYSEKSLCELIARHRPDALISYLTDAVTGRVLSSWKGLKMVSNYAAGYNNIDLDAAKKAGITVANTPTDGYYVAEFTASLAVTLSRRIVEAHKFTVAGKYKGWDANLFLGSVLRGKTLAIIGAGRIGANAAKILSNGFGMKVIYSDAVRNEVIEKELGARHVEIDEAFSQADIVSLHVPLLESTRHLVDSRRLSLMKKTAFLINTSRGPVVDEAALAKTLKKRGIAGAALDVFEFEPKVSRALRSLPNVILTPHIASATIEARESMSQVAASNVIDFFAGRQPVGLIRTS